MLETKPSMLLFAAKNEEYNAIPQLLQQSLKPKIYTFWTKKNSLEEKKLAQATHMRCSCSISTYSEKISGD